MEGKLLNEISYLTQLIERHKRTTNQKSYNVQQNAKLCDTNANMQKYCNSTSVELPSVSKMQWQTQNNYSYVKPEVLSRKVHVNPNFKSRSSTIHINPRIHAKSSVYVNPKMMRNITATKSEKQSSNIIGIQQNQNDEEIKVERSIYVNPKLMRELSAKTCTSNIATDSKMTNLESNCKTCSKTKLVNSGAVPNAMPKRTLNSSFISLSRRKLIRTRRNTKGSINTPSTNLDRIKRISCSALRKTKIVTRYKLVTGIDGCVNKSDGIVSRLKFIKNNGGKSGSSKYKIDRTTMQKEKHDGNSGVKKTIGSTMGLVRIGGILYKSSRNQLVRSSNDTPSKRKRCIINVKGDRFVMASNGKKLRRLSSIGEGSGNNNYSPRSRVDIGGMTFVEKTPNVLVRSNAKSNISNKVKQRSIQILRNKMRKNNQPCLLFQRFGYCANQVNGTCPKLHDKKQIALCRKFLQGKCLLDNCPMSHDVGPEKMPTCRYFLEGCCNRDACPYLHVKVSSNTPICMQFLRGYCAEANKCKQRHVYMCPEFDRTGKCSRGKYCPYPHKEIRKRSRKILRRKDDTSESQVAKSNAISSVASSQAENKKRYYEGDNLNERISNQKEVIMKKVKMMKKSTQPIELVDDELNVTYLGTAEKNEVAFVDHKMSDTEKELNCDSERRKRPPIGPLPSYIPIN